MARRAGIVLVVLALALSAMACNLSGGDGSGGQSQNVVQGNAPTVEIRVPANNTSYAEGTQVMIQAQASDSGGGVSRVELLVDDVVIDDSTAPAAQGQPVLPAVLQWTAEGVGLHSVTVIAYRADGTASTPSTINLNVVAGRATQAPTSTPTTEPVEEPTSEPAAGENGGGEAAQADNPPAEPTAVPASATPSAPRGVTTIGLNVRSGPGTLYPVIGAFLANQDIELVGRNVDSSWWVVPFGSRQGWVAAQFVTSTGDTGSLPVVSAPPPPPTATPTPIVPTAPPPPPTSAAPSITFTSTAPSGGVASGTTIRLEWTTSNVREVYLNGEGVPGSGFREVRPTQTTNYTLRVVKQDGTTEERTVTVIVTGAGGSANILSFTSTAPSGPVASGTVIRFTWETANVREVLFNGQGVPGSGPSAFREVTVTATSTYTLRVIRTDGSAEERSITVTVQ